MTWVVVLSAAAASALLMPWHARSRPPPGEAAAVPVGDDERDLLTRGRLVWIGLAFVAGLVFGPDGLGLPSGLAAAVAVWWVVDHAEPAARRRRREAVRRELPHLVELYAAALAAGSAPAPALTLACAALPGPAAEELREVQAGLALGRSSLEVWQELATHPALGPLGRTMARAQESGAPVVDAVRLLADDLAAGARLDVEDQARAVGVKAALPLGLCLLPAFLLLGIVPLVVGAATGIRW